MVLSLAGLSLVVLFSRFSPSILVQQAICTECRNTTTITISHLFNQALPSFKMQRSTPCTSPPVIQALHLKLRTLLSPPLTAPLIRQVRKTRENLSARKINNLFPKKETKRPGKPAAFLRPICSRNQHAHGSGEQSPSTMCRKTMTSPPLLMKSKVKLLVIQQTKRVRGRWEGGGKEQQ